MVFGGDASWITGGLRRKTAAAGLCRSENGQEAGHQHKVQCWALRLLATEWGECGEEAEALRSGLPPCVPPYLSSADLLGSRGVCGHMIACPWCPLLVYTGYERPSLRGPFVAPWYLTVWWFVALSCVPRVSRSDCYFTLSLVLCRVRARPDLGSAGCLG